SGFKETSLYLTTGPLRISTTQLTLKAISREDVTCNPGEVVFRPSEGNLTKEKTVDVDYAGEKDFQVLEAVAPKSAPFEASAKRFEQRPGFVRFRITVQMKKDAAPRRFADFVKVQTNDPLMAQFSLSVSGNAPIEVLPPRLELGTVHPGDEVIRRVI